MSVALSLIAISGFFIGFFATPFRLFAGAVVGTIAILAAGTNEGWSHSAIALWWFGAFFVFELTLGTGAYARREIWGLPRSGRLTAAE